MTDEKLNLKIQAIEIVKRGRAKGDSDKQMIGDIADMLMMSGKKYTNPVSSATRMFECVDKMIDAISLYEEGKSQKEVSTMLGISTINACIYAKFAKSMGINVISGMVGGNMVANMESIISDMRAGMSNREIADKYGVKFGNVSQLRNKLRKKEIAETGETTIPNGYSVHSENEKEAFREFRKQMGKTISEDGTLRVTEKNAYRRGVDMKDLEIYNENIKSLKEEEIEMLEFDMESKCNVYLNEGMSINEVYDKMNKMNWFTRIRLTTDYLEGLIYGSTLKSIEKYASEPSNIDVVYSFKNGMFVYRYQAESDNVKEYVKPMCSELAKLLLDENGNGRRTIEESAMITINHWARTGNWIECGVDRTIRFITYENGLVDELRKYI